MIDFINHSKEKPHIKFMETYKKAIAADQKSIEAVAISSFDQELNSVDSRFVNLKIIENNNYIFFSNYQSAKSFQFNLSNKISALFYWNNINTQIRIKAIIKKTSTEFNKEYFIKRSANKNALAISSNQSKKIDSYEAVKENYNRSFKSADLNICPSYWGGYSFTPYYFEFWEGHESRINKRDVYEFSDDNWNQFFLQP